MNVLKQGSRVYFIAICGTGMSALAGLLKSRGCDVRGSDVAAYPPVGPLLQGLGIPIQMGYEVSDIENFKPDYVVIGNFVRRDNPQAEWVMRNQIPFGSLPSTMEDQLLQKTKNIVISGTHGKSTTTSATAFILASAKKDPSFFVGAVPTNFGQSFFLGGGDYFVLEGDEYDTAFFDKESKFLHYRPHIAVLMSLEFDHADIFSSVEAIEVMFEKFLRLVPKEGCILYCRDWERVHRLVSKEKRAPRVQSFGFHRESEVKIEDFRESEAGMSFVLGGSRFTNPMTGSFNAQNLAAAIAVGRLCGVSEAALTAGVQGFLGLKRRQEVRAKIGETLVIDDFAHHPTAVREVIQGLRMKYPKHKLVVFFEPRSNTSRRNLLQAEYDTAFAGADVAMVAPIFKAESIDEKERLNLDQMLRSHLKLGVDFQAPVSVEEMIEKSLLLQKGGACAFIVLSNGGFENLHERLISALKER